MKHYHIAIALIWKDGRLLVTKRRDDADHMAGFWEFPGGKCEGGETPQQGVLREVEEEVGLKVAITGERTTITHTYPERSVTLYPFDCTIIEGEPYPLQSVAIRWIASDELRTDEFPAANITLIQELMAG